MHRVIKVCRGSGGKDYIRFDVSLMLIIQNELICDFVNQSVTGNQSILPLLQQACSET
jgi:hypothetical protein